MQQTPFSEREYLYTYEAIEYWGLSQRKFYKFLAEGTYDSIAYYGKRKLILRVKFERYICKNHDIWEALKRRGKKRRCTEG